MKRTLGALLAVTFLFGAILPARAGGRETGTYFRAETAGLPASTMLGGWSSSDDGREVELEFNGGHLIGTGTSIEAGWLSPWTPAGEVPEFEESYELENMNDMGEKIVLLVSTRMREKGRKWEPWFRDRITLKAGSSTTAGGAIAIIFLTNRKDHEWRPMRFEWKLETVIEGPSYLEGNYSIRIN